MSIDQEIYQGLKRILVASGQMNTVIDTFLANTEERLSALSKALTANNPEEVFRIAHSIKGSCSMLGGVHCAELCKAIEDGTKLMNSGDLKQLSELLSLELEKMAEFLRKEKTSDKTDCCE